jgi:hypothetical protein
MKRRAMYVQPSRARAGERGATNDTLTVARDVRYSGVFEGRLVRGNEPSIVS